MLPIHAKLIYAIKLGAKKSTLLHIGYINFITATKTNFNAVQDQKPNNQRHKKHTLIYRFLP